MIGILKRYPEIQYDEITQYYSPYCSKTMIRYSTIIDNKPFYNTYLYDKENRFIDINNIKNMLKDDLIISANKYLNFDQIFHKNNINV
jgi:hypothetical protein